MPRVARDLLATDPLTVAAATPVLEVQHVLVLAQVSAMPVVEENGKVIGVVTASDVLRAVDQALDLDGGDLLAPLRSLTARDIASNDLVWVDPDMPATDVASRMRSARVERVLVGVNGALDGMLTAYDLLVAVA